jgi:hypothetical protein
VLERPLVLECPNPDIAESTCVCPKAIEFFEFVYTSLKRQHLNAKRRSVGRHALPTAVGIAGVDVEQ